MFTTLEIEAASKNGFDMKAVMAHFAKLKGLPTSESLKDQLIRELHVAQIFRENYKSEAPVHFYGISEWYVNDMQGLTGLSRNEIRRLFVLFSKPARVKSNDVMLSRVFRSSCEECGVEFSYDTCCTCCGKCFQCNKCDEQMNENSFYDEFASENNA